MLISPAFAQATGEGQPFDPGFLVMIGLLFVIMYVFMFRPQQKRAKQHREMISAVRRGDTVVTQGGLIGKVSKVVGDDEVMVEIAEGVRVRIVKTTLTDVRGKTEPVSSDSSGSSGKSGKGGKDS
ncbi:MAG: preprotein translocase subunit YajC [Rhodospirillales bacterium]|nr:preprotein translocase subunit YajC [Rhodospirillales bacterium]